MNIFSKSMSYKEYIKYLIPSIMTMIFLSFYTTIDGYFVSKYAGSNALAGINIVIPVTCIVFGTAVMLATGCSAIIGEYLGKKEEKKANEVFTMTSVFLLILAILFTVTGILFLKPVAVLLGTSERLMPHVLPYLFVVLTGTVPMAFKLFFEYLVRTDGHPHMGLIMSSTGLILNVILDYVFVGIFDLETYGAALGTVVSISASALIGLVYFLKYGILKFCRFRFNLGILWKSCTNGSSEMLTELSTGITTLLFNLIIIKSFGEDGVAAVTIIMYIYYFFIAFYMGIAVATAPVVSFNLGAGNKGKIMETLRYSFVTILITAILILTTLFFFGNNIISLFVQSGPVYDLTTKALIYFSPVFMFIGINVFLSGYFTALGDGLTSAIISSLRSLIFVILFIIILPMIIGVNGIWLTMAFSEFFTIIISLLLFNRKGKIELI